jgi:filamentous hemagglutinin family protein
MLKSARGSVMTVAGLFALGMSHGAANPTGGSVAAGCASINTCPGVVTVCQQSNVAVINWQSFSICAGELTKFVQPCSSSAVLNRVCGGQTSVINGTLCANGEVYLVNGNGIVIGPTGMVNANSFTASTRDVSDCDFMSGHLHFKSDNEAGVQNMGTINALGGNVYLLGKTVDNEGTINARHGTVGLAAGDDIVLAQKCDGGTVTVLPGCSGANEAGKTAVKNGGSITAASAQLKAANGNLYALAINNSGTIRATTVRHQGGHIFLTADSGTVVNSGTLDASATACGGHGGTVVMKSAHGTAIDSGTILARGGQGGAGGQAEVSGKILEYHGTTDLTAPNGTTGTITFDPANIIIQGIDSGSTSHASILTVADLENTIQTANIVVDAGLTGGGDLTLSAPLTWTSSNSLTLGAGNSIFLNGNITASNGGLALNAGNAVTSGAEGAINPAGVAANVDVESFTMIGGSWVQSSPLLPVFEDTGAFDLLNNSTFIRSAGGEGTTPDPFHIVDNFGIDGIPTFPAGTVYVLGFPTDVSSAEIDSSGELALLAFDAYTSNTSSILVSSDFTPGANDLVSVNDPTSDGGAVNNDGGKEKKGTNIASGSSTAGMPSPSRLLTAGSGINTIFGGCVSAIQAPPFVQQQLDSILGSPCQAALGQATFGTH